MFLNDNIITAYDKLTLELQEVIVGVYIGCNKSKKERAEQRRQRSRCLSRGCDMCGNMIRLPLNVMRKIKTRKRGGYNSD